MPLLLLTLVKGVFYLVTSSLFFQITSVHYLWLLSVYFLLCIFFGCWNGAGAIIHVSTQCLCLCSSLFLWIRPSSCSFFFFFFFFLTCGRGNEPLLLLSFHVYIHTFHIKFLLIIYMLQKKKANATFSETSVNGSWYHFYGGGGGGNGGGVKIISSANLITHCSRWRLSGAVLFC